MNLQLSMAALTAKLENCGQVVATEGKRKALRAGAAVLKDAMQAQAPVLDEKTAGSTALEPGSLRDGTRIYLKDEDGEPVALVGPSAKVERVARWVEFGHRMVHGGYSKVMPNGKTRGPGTAAEIDVQAHPYLRPAYESSLAETREAEKLSLQQTIAENTR